MTLEKAMLNGLRHMCEIYSLILEDNPISRSYIIGLFVCFSSVSLSVCMSMKRSVLRSSTT